MQLWQSFYIGVPLGTREMAKGSGRGDIYQTSWPVYGLQLDRVMSDRCAPMRVKTGSDNPDMGFELQSALKGLRAPPICFQTWHPMCFGARTMEFSITTFPVKKCCSIVNTFVMDCVSCIYPCCRQSTTGISGPKIQQVVPRVHIHVGTQFFQCVCRCKSFLKGSCKICLHSLLFLSTVVRNFKIHVVHYLDWFNRERAP